MSNPTVVERMADAIAAAKSNTDKALAALEALRVPSEGMVEALNGYAVCAGYIPEGWAAAIDAAISEHKGK